MVVLFLFIQTARSIFFLVPNDDRFMSNNFFFFKKKSIKAGEGACLTACRSCVEEQRRRSGFERAGRVDLDQSLGWLPRDLVTCFCSLVRNSVRRLMMGWRSSGAMNPALESVRVPSQSMCGN